MSEALMNEEKVLDKLAFSMMTAELTRHASGKDLDHVLRVPSEVQRTYKRLLASGEAREMLAILTKHGLVIGLAGGAE